MVGGIWAEHRVSQGHRGFSVNSREMPQPVGTGGEAVSLVLFGGAPTREEDPDEGPGLGRGTEGVEQPQPSCLWSGSPLVGISPPVFSVTPQTIPGSQGHKCPQLCEQLLSPLWVRQGQPSQGLLRGVPSSRGDSGMCRAGRRSQACRRQGLSLGSGRSAALVAARAHGLWAGAPSVSCAAPAQGKLPDPRFGGLGPGPRLTTGSGQVDAGALGCRSSGEGWPRCRTWKLPGPEGTGGNRGLGRGGGQLGPSRLRGCQCAGRSSRPTSPQGCRARSGPGAGGDGGQLAGETGSEVWPLRPHPGCRMSSVVQGPALALGVWAKLACP